MDRGAWWAIVHRVEQSRTRLNDLAHKPSCGPSIVRTVSSAPLFLAESMVYQLCPSAHTPDALALEPNPLRSEAGGASCSG